MIQAARLDDLVEDAALRIVLDGRPVLLTLVGGAPRAMSDVCPHNGASLSDGLMRDGCVTCPWHFWRFSTEDGQRQGAPGASVPTYASVVEDGWVYVELPPAEPQRSMREILLAHARGEM